MRRYVVIGCNQGSAGPEDVGRAQIPAERVAEVLPALKSELGAQELVYLATCHRSEFYLAYQGPLCPGRLLMALAAALPRLTGGACALPGIEKCLAEHELNASRHLFRVAAALDSLMPGDNQILGQVKGAYRLAADLGVAGPRLSALFTQAFRAAKRVRTETNLSRLPVSLLSLAERQLGRRLAEATGAVAVVGAGSMAALAVELVRKLDPARAIVVFNRSRERGEAFAAACRGEYRPLESLAAGGSFAAVITAASSQVALISPETAARLAPTLLLDLGMPPNVAPGCAEIAGVEHVDQVALRREADANRAARSAEIAQAEAIVEEQLRELAYEVMEVELSPVARHLVATFREVARTELARMVDGGSEASREQRLDEAVDRLSQRLVRVPLRGLREVAWHHSADVLTTFLAAVEK